MPINGNLEINAFGRVWKVSAIPYLFVNKVKSKLKKDYGMNPLQSWCDNNKELAKLWDDYVVNNVCVLGMYPDLKKDTLWLFKNGSAIEKIQAISLIGSVKMLFSK